MKPQIWHLWLPQSPSPQTFPLTIHTVCNLHAILGTNCLEPHITFYLLPFFFPPSSPSQSFLPFPSQLPVLSYSRHARTSPCSVAQASHFIRAEPTNEPHCLSHLSHVDLSFSELIRVTILYSLTVMRYVTTPIKTSVTVYGDILA